MRVVKRNGKLEEVKFDKIIQRIKSLSKDLTLDAAYLAQKAIRGLHDNISTKDIDTYLSETSAVLSAQHPHYGKLAARIAISSLHKDTHPSFFHTSKALYKAGILSDQYIVKVKEHADELDKLIDFSRDFDFDYFGYKTLERSYLLKIDGKIIERPQHLFLRVAVELGDDLKDIGDIYNNLSQGLYTHATPTLFNSGTRCPQLSSCFLKGLDDSIDGIFDALKDVAHISKYAGGIGVHVHNLRSKGSHIKGTNGQSSGIVPFLQIFNATARAVDQAGRRKGSIAIYLEPWHADIQDFLELKKPTGKEELRARDLFLALWIPDLFMERVEKDQHWTLMCPNIQTGLSDCYGHDFRVLYEQYERDYPNLKRIKARALMTQIIESMLESGTPYILFKDACNEKSNQKNIGIIKSSNLCLVPGTQVLTKEGARPIEDLVGEEVEVWDGDQWVLVDSFRRTSPFERIVRVHLCDGSYFDCTPSHSVPLEENWVVRAIDLIDGDIIQHHTKCPLTVSTEVKSVEMLDNESEVYCCTVTSSHQFGLANGLMTGNCTEIVEVSDSNETAVCNLASICLPRFVDVENKTFDFEGLQKMAYSATRHLDAVIDKTFYPIEKAKRSNLRHRPIGLGVQGLCDVFFMLGLPYESTGAAELDKAIFAHIYYGALSASCDLAKKHGAYETYKGSPAAQGNLQFDLWQEEGLPALDWAALKTRIELHGLRNSLLTALMPTASTSQIFGNTECFEIITSNAYKRQTLAGEFVVVNKYLVADLERLGLWSPELSEQIIANNGSIQSLEQIPKEVRDVYKTVWEIPQRIVIDRAAARSPYICQSQSMNLFFARPNFGTINSALFYGWKKGLKTGCYYTRTQPSVDAVKVTTDTSRVAQENALACSIDNREACLSCQ